jgi:MFS family permease
MQTPKSKVTGSGRISGVALLVASAFFMEFLDGTVIATALPDMANAFGVSAIDLNIGISAYLLTLAMLIPASGWVAERFGARTVFSLALLIFTVASLCCGLTQNVTGFVLMRVLQGVGGAMMVPVGRLVVLRTTPKDQLIKAIATLTWPALVAPLLPSAGGFITTYASWHWIFFLNVPLGLVAIVLALKLMPGLSADEKRPFDVIGFIATGLTMLCLVAGLEMFSQQPVSVVSAGATLTVGAGAGMEYSPFAACACAVNRPEFAVGAFLSHHHARRVYFPRHHQRRTVYAALDVPGRLWDERV